MLVLVSFVATFPVRNLPLVSGASVATVSPSPIVGPDKWFCLPPRIKPEEELRDVAVQTDGIRPAYEIAIALYFLAFYSIASQGKFGASVIRAAGDAQLCIDKVLVPAFLYASAIFASLYIARSGPTQHVVAFVKRSFRSVFALSSIRAK